MPITIASLDHLVLTVADIAATCDFYERVLGMRSKEFQPGRWALYFGRQKLNLHPADRVLDKNVRHATPGSADLCLITETPMAAVTAHLEAEGVEIILGPVDRSGAVAPLNSVYFHDPDENLIEVANQV